MRAELTAETRLRATIDSLPLIRPCGATFPQGGRLGECKLFHQNLDYGFSYVVTAFASDKTTISVAVKTLEGADILNWGSLMAACAIVVVPSIIFFCFIQNKMAGGLSDGAVK